MEVTKDEQLEEVSAYAPQSRQETREDMLSRHREEISQLQGKEITMKKAATNGSKAEQKAKKKQVEAKIAKLSTKLKEKHAKELATLGYNNDSNSNGKEKGDLDTLVKAIAGVSVTNQSKHSKPSKSAKRREKRAQEEAAREQRIQEEQKNTISNATVENEKLEEKLEPLGLVVNEIKPDGHCLYRAVTDQLAIQSGGSGSSPYTFLQLRKMVAEYMRNHSCDFLPFLPADDHGDSSDEMFEKYCREVESTTAWGGQLEIGALTHCLKKHIIIYSGSFPDVEMGNEYKSKFGSIMLSYHRHAYGLGEHYNSVVPHEFRDF